MVFFVGDAYSRKQIYEQCGGSLQTYLPCKDGVVVAACLTVEMNPQAPCIILCGNGPSVRQAGECLVSQARPIPVFIKNINRQWIFQGYFEVVESFVDSADCAPYLQGAGRNQESTSRVVRLRLV